MKKHYFLVVSIVMLALSILAFSDNLITDVGQKSNSDPKFIIHGLFCFTWFIILVFQTNFIKKGNYQAHKRLGIAGLIAAIGVFITTLYIFVVTYNGWNEMSPEARANRFLMLGFAIFVTLAYLNRKKTAEHKRLIIVASFFMLGPILGRAIGHSFLNAMLESDLSWDFTFLGIWSSFFISLFLYDLAVIRRIHTITYSGFLIFGVVWAISFLL